MPQCAAVVGIGGAARPGDWTPICFQFATNKGPSTTAEITLVANAPSSSGSQGPGRVVYSAEVEIPRDSAKSETIFARFGAFEKALVRYSGGHPIEVPTLAKEVGSNDLLIAVLGGEPGLLRFLHGQPVLTSNRARFGQLVISGHARHPSAAGTIHVAQVLSRSAPRHWLGWESADVVVLADDGRSPADPATISALLQWVRSGGVLFVPGGMKALVHASGAVGPYLPYAVSGTTDAGSIETLARWVDKRPPESVGLLTQGALAPGAVGMPATSGDPMIAARPLGAGRIVMTRFDPFADPVKGWSGTGDLLTRVFAESAAACCRPGAPALHPEYMSRSSLELAPAELAKHTPEARLPSIWLVVGFLVVYVLCLSPVNYLFLKRIDRRELAWLTTPVIVAVFTVGAYGIGYGIRGGSIILNRVSIVDCAAGQGLARARAYIGLFSPTRRSYDISIPERAADDVSDPSVPSRLEVLCQDPPLLSDVSMNMWSTRAFSVETLADLGKGLDGVIEYDGRELSATVRNNTGKALRRVTLLGAGGQSAQVDLAPGAEKELTCTPATAPVSSPGYSPPRPDVKLDELLFDGLLLGQPRFTSRFGYYGPTGMSGAPEMRWPCVAAICEAPLVDAELRRASPRTQDCNLLLANLPVRLKGNASVDVPYWLVRQECIQAQGDVETGQPRVGGIMPHPNGSGQAITLIGGQATLQFRVPVGPRGQRVDFLRFAHHTIFNESQVGLPPATARGEWCRAWNHVKGTWEAGTVCADVSMDTMNRTNFVFRRPEEFISPDGRVVVELSTPHGEQMQFENLRLAAKLSTR
ncbi:MAG: hypothetical protein HPY44_13570 [Armatimonadetes bacterium]|nr:hypothetical protein [Armatimonadota bacterium]